MTERSELTPGSASVTFGDVVRLCTERCADPASAGIERYVGLEHLEPVDLKIRSWGLVSNGVTFTNLFKRGQVLFGKRRAYQRKAAIADFEGVCSGDIYVFEPAGDRLMPELLPFLCQSDAFVEHALKTSAGSLSPRTNWKSLSDFSFVLPPRSVQQMYARTFATLEAAIDAFADLAKVSESAERRLREDLCDAQPSCRLGTLLERIEAGVSVIGTASPPVEGQFGVLKVSAVGKLGFQSREAKTLVNPDDFVESFRVCLGDLLITRCNTPDLVGLSCLCDKDYPNLMLCDKTLRLVPRRGVSAHSMWNALQTESVRQQLKKVASGTGAAMKNISQDRIRGLTVRLPDDGSGVGAEKVEGLRKAAALARERVRQLQFLKARVLGRAFGRHGAPE